jgi:peptidoglycan/LPS O-acetylase OafA/YrhL
MIVVEPEVIYRSTGTDWRGGPLVISGSLYAVAFIPCFLAFHELPIPLSGIFNQLGKKSYGIYLIHPTVLEFVARLIQQFLPWMLAYQVLFQPVLVVSAIGAPVLLMATVARSPARRAYRYLFG